MMDPPPRVSLVVTRKGTQNGQGSGLRIVMLRVRVRAMVVEKVVVAISCLGLSL